MDTNKLLSEFANVLNHSGPYSTEAETFLAIHQDNREFFQLAHVAQALKVVMAPASVPPTQQLIAQLANIIRCSGPVSSDVEAFLTTHKDAPEIQMLRRVAVMAKASHQVGLLNKA